MEKLIKAAFIAGVICLCACIVPDVGNNIISLQYNKKLAVKAETKQDKKIYKYAQDKKKTSKFNSIKAECNSLDIVIDKSGSKDFYVSYELDCLNGNDPISYKVKDGVLYIKELKLEWPHYLNKWDRSKGYINKIYVYIPSDSDLKDFDIDTEMGDLYIKNISVEDGKFNTKIGDLDIAGSKFLGRIDVNTDSGDIDISKSVINKTFNIKTECGDIGVYNSKIGGKLGIRTSSGDVDMLFNKKLIDKLGINMLAKFGDMHINRLYKGTKMKKGSGYMYTKNINVDKSTKPFLNVIALYGSIGLN